MRNMAPPSPLSKLCSLALGLAASVSTTALAEPLSWQASVEETSRSNSELNSARHSQQSADYASTAAYSGFWPQVSASLGYTRSSAQTVDTSGTTSFVTNMRNDYEAAISASQNLFSGLSDRAKVDQAEASLGIANASLDTTRAKVSYDLKSAFAGLVYAQSAIKLSDDILKRREANLHLVQLRFESGRENSGSVLLSKAYLEQAKYDRLQAGNDLETARAQLARVLGRDNPETVEINGVVPVSTPPDAGDLKRLAMETPAYQDSVAREEYASAGIVAARSAFFPTLNLSGSTGKSGGDWFPDRDRWSLGATLTLPLFNGGRDYYGTQSASQTWKAATETRENKLRDTLSTLKGNYFNYVEAVQKLEVDRAFKSAAEAREKIAVEKYNNGLLTFDDWDIIENDLISREKTFIQSERDRVTAEAAWEQVLGKGAIP